MNTLLRSAKIIGPGSLLALMLSFSTSLYAGPSPEYWQRMRQFEADHKAPVTNTVDAQKNSAPTQLPCESCQTVTLRESGWIGPPSKGRRESVAIGAKHTCEVCGGEIKVVRGSTTNTMQHNCPKCKDSLHCSLADQAPAVKS